MVLSFLIAIPSPVIPVIIPVVVLISIVEFLSVDGIETAELVSPALVIVTLFPSIAIPISLFKNLFVLVWPVPPAPTGTALLTSPFEAKPAVALAAPPCTVAAAVPFTLLTSLAVLSPVTSAPSVYESPSLPFVIVVVSVVPSPFVKVNTPEFPWLISMPLFKNLFVFVWPVPPTPTGTALFTFPLLSSPALALTAPVLVLPVSLTSSRSSVPPPAPPKTPADVKVIPAFLIDLVASSGSSPALNLPKRVLLVESSTS